MFATTEGWPCAALRALAQGLHRLADRLEGIRTRALPLEPVRARDGAEERIDTLRHRLITRYY